MNSYIIGIRFNPGGKIYHFDASRFRDIATGDFAVVETSRGQQLGEVIQILQDPSMPIEGKWKPILRKATPRDLVRRQYWQRKELEATINCRAKATEINLVDVKIIASEFSFDGSRLSFLYSTEAGAKVDLRPLRNKMKRTYPKCRIEMRQIGPRDVAKIIGGMGACGLGKRCCSMFLTEFSPISIKMAKEQGVSLSPSEITGMCGRLRCCLIFEFEQYVKARKNLPKRGKMVLTPKGEGKVVDVFPLKNAVLVDFGNSITYEFENEELEPSEELKALKKKSKENCSDKGGNNCECSKEKNGN
jgi:cell fate regulator YaaT (PSP1 superfamily)